MCCEFLGDKKCCGVLIILFGLIWYLHETNVIALEPFWPIMVMLFGVIVVLKGFMLKPVKKK